MGFEIKYFYKETSEEPGVYKDEILEKIQKIGKFDEEIPLEIVAGKIISQLARRSILIVDVEINEYAKKKISYKETESGILIKNKKFSFDTGACVESSEDYEEELSKILQDEVLLNKIKESIGLSSGKKVNLAQRPNKINKKILRREIYDPEPIAKSKIEQRGLKLTVGKSYPIYEEKSKAGILSYNISDDSGREVEVLAEVFVAQPSGLLFEEEGPVYFGGENQKEVDIWKNTNIEHEVPDLR